MSLAPRVTTCADAILARIGFLSNPYFTALKDGSMSQEDFRASQEQFYFAVRYFPRPMAALISRMSDSIQRIDLLHNIVEEHGDFRQEQFHQNTFRKFLASIGGRSPDQPGVTMGPAVHAFNNVLMAACLSNEIPIGVCCLGIIEHAFANVSAFIGKTVVERGWVAAANLTHYALHAELDVRHAEEFFVIVESVWDKADGQAAIRQGLELGAYAFDQLYRNLIPWRDCADA
jgi:pyrroloquinoline-quinone synthase